MSSLGTRRWAAWIGVFALVVQLFLPTLHAQGMAQRHDAPLLALFCGDLSPGAVEALRDNLPPELLERLPDAEAASVSDIELRFCASLHGHAAAGGGSVAGLGFEAQALVPSSAIEARAPVVRLVRLPPLRAPPILI